ncbi:MAG: Gfo/Idh/MocA family oxidoreductase [Erysipelotrichaceae bacterium]|nr:Gfo/Idh/MocA family oxidoreductase [Erysipelotrichaceae bacterium]
MLELFAKLDAYQCEALFCRKVSENRGRKLVNKFGIGKLYLTIEDFLADKSFDTVYVAVINNYHYEYCKRALLAGKNVICEKPFTVTYEQALELSLIAKQYNLMIYELSRNVLTKAYSNIKTNLIKIGKVSQFTASLCHYSRRYDDYQNGIIAPVFDASKAGGALYDFGIYALHFVVGLFGKPNSVRYDDIKGIDGVDLAGTLILKYDQLIASINLSKISNAPAYFCIQGEKGYIHSNSAMMFIQEVLLCSKDHIESIATKNHNVVYEELLEIEKMFREKDHKQLNKYIHDTLICIEIIDGIKRRGIDEDKANIDE